MTRVLILTGWLFAVFGMMLLAGYLNPRPLPTGAAWYRYVASVTQ